MSSTDHTDTLPTDSIDDENPLDEVAERRELFERIAQAGLPISPACERALEKLDENEDEP